MDHDKSTTSPTSVRDAVISRLFMRLSKTYLRHKAIRTIIHQRRKTNRRHASKISFLSARSCCLLWNRPANKSQVCLCLKILDLHPSTGRLKLKKHCTIRALSSLRQAFRDQRDRVSLFGRNKFVQYKLVGAKLFFRIRTKQTLCTNLLLRPHKS